jgi:hypothetical protein
LTAFNSLEQIGVSPFGSGQEQVSYSGKYLYPQISYRSFSSAPDILANIPSTEGRMYADQKGCSLILRKFSIISRG